METKLPIDPRRLSRSQQRRRQVAAAAKAAMSHDGLSLRRAARIYHIAPTTIRRWFPGSIVRDASGRYRAHPDRERFRMVAVAVGGPVEVWTNGSQERALIGAHGQAIRTALDPRIRDVRLLRALQGSRVGGLDLETDPNELVELFLAGELDFLEIYLSADIDG